MKRQNFFKNLPLMLLTLLAGFLLLFRLGENSLTNWDEAWLASVAQDMVSHGDWLKPQWNGEPWFYEPPLLTLILAAIMKFLGNTEFLLRSFNAVSGLATVLITYLLAQLLFKNSTSILPSIEVKVKARLAGVFAALVLLSDIEFLFRSRQINNDIPLTMLLLLVFYATLQFAKKNSTGWLVVASTSLSLAFLTKRASALLILPTILFILIRNKHRFNKKAILIGLTAFLAVVTPWFLFSYFQWGDIFIRRFFWGYTVAKVVSVNPETGISWLFYINALKHAFKVWFLILPIALIWFAAYVRKNWQVTALLVYFLTFFIILSLVPIKSSWFLLPIHPLAAIMIGGFLSHLAAASFTLRLSPGLKLSVMLGVLGIFVFQIANWHDQFIVPETTRHQANLAQKVKQLTAPTETIFLDDDYLPVAVYYSQRRVVPLRFNRQIIDSNVSIQLPINSYILSNRETYPHLTLMDEKVFKQVETNGKLILLRVEPRFETK